jgi:ribose-phosphate pyrophosphokinase
VIFVDTKKIEFGEFPNKESYLNFNTFSFGPKSLVTLKFESDQDLFNLYILKKYMDETFKNNNFELQVLYFPYSRMDRRNQFYTFNLKYVAQLINDMKFSKVIVYDAHSDVSLALIDNCVSSGNISTLFSLFQNEHGMNNTFIFYPDSGAQKRYEKSFAYPTLVGIKSRDFESGAIDSYQILGGFKSDSDVVMIDDLCSKGGTFIGAAKELKKIGAKDIYLIVGHCENNIENGEIFKTDLIKTVYTTDSIYSGGNACPEKLKILNLMSVCREDA